MSSTIAVLAMSVQMLVVLMGYPLQIRELKNVPVCVGIPVAKWLIIDLAHLLWMTHSVLQKDWALFLPNIPGFLFAMWITVLIMKKSPSKAL